MFGFLKHLFRLHFILLVSAVIIGVYHEEIKEAIRTRWLVENDMKDEAGIQAKLSKENYPKLFTKEELSNFTGENNQPIYLAIVGSVYDVSKGVKHYGPGCSYSFFAGRDASLSFVTGEFEKYDAELSDDVLSLKPGELLSLDNWKQFYDKDYIFKGKLIGRFYNENGEKTPYYYKYSALVEQARQAKTAADQMKDKYPDCNIEWSKETGTRVWCTITSGNGKEREWAGYPRQLFELHKDGFRCACVRKEDLNTSEVMLKPYENCDLSSRECYYHVD